MELVLKYGLYELVRPQMKLQEKVLLDFVSATQSCQLMNEQKDENNTSLRSSSRWIPAEWTWLCGAVLTPAPN